MGEISQEEMERLLRRADFSAETDCKARLWDCLTELLALAQAEGSDAGGGGGVSGGAFRP